MRDKSWRNMTNTCEEKKMQYVHDEIGDDVVVPTNYFADENEAITLLSSNDPIA